jgi:isoleucyl-tRNA synthetase
MQANSVHLEKTPNFNEIPYNAGIVGAMSLVRKICNGALSIRKKNNIKSRIPLSSITIAGKCDSIKQSKMLIETIQDEINVKEVIFLEDFSNFAVKQIVNLDSSKTAKRLGKEFQAVLQMAKKGIFEHLGKNIKINGHEIFADEFEIQLVLEDSANYTSVDGKYLIILDTKITQTLQNEGIARDFVRAIQNARKDASLNVADYIHIEVNAKSHEFEEAINENLEYVKLQVLATNVNFIKCEIQNGVVFGEDASFTIKV